MAKKRNTRFFTDRFRNTISNVIDWLSLILCIAIGAFLLFCNCPNDTDEKFLIVVIGLLGTLYCVYYLWLWFFCPIKRDYLLVRGSFFRKVCCFVLYIPFVFTMLPVCFSHCPKDDEAAVGKQECEEKAHIDTAYCKLTKELFYIENVFAPDTTHIPYGTIAVNHTPSADTLTQADTLAAVVRHAMLQTYVELQELQEGEDGYIKVNREPPVSICAEEEPNLFWTIYMHFLDPGNQHMVTSKKGRGWAAAVSILGLLFLNGLLISTLVNYFNRRKERWQNGEVRYGRRCLGKDRFAVVIGMHNIAPTIIRELLEGKGEKSKLRYVLLLVDEKAQEAREKVESYLTEQQKSQLIVYSGQLDSMEVISGLNLRHAAELYVLGKNKADDVSNSYHDTQNMRIVHTIASYLTDKCVYRKKVCRVLFEYQTIFSVFQFSDLAPAIKDRLVFIPFNTYEDWAQRVLVYGNYTELHNNVLCIPQQEAIEDTWWNMLGYKVSLGIQGMLNKSGTHSFVIDYKPLDGGGIGYDSGKYVHFIVVGMNKMGIAMAQQAAQIAHYPNFESACHKEKLRTRITFIDENADKQMSFFMGRYRNMFDLARYRYLDAKCLENALGDELSWIDPMKEEGNPYCYMGDNFLDIEWEFVKGTVDQSHVAAYLKHAAGQAKDNSIMTVAICLPCSNEALASALYMPGEVYDYANDIWVYQREAGDIVFNLMESNERNQNKRYSKLRPFGMEYANFTMASKNIYHRAQLCGYVYELCGNKDKIHNDKIPEVIEKIASTSDKAKMTPARDLWKKTSIFNKWSNMYLANSFETKLRSAKCPTQNYAANCSTNKELLAERMDDYAKCEHDRWNVQQLLMGFRAYTKEDNEEYKRLYKNKDDSPEAAQVFKTYKKNKKEGSDKAHLNICSFSRLDIVDKGIKAYDIAFIRAIPSILQVVEEGNKATNSVS